MSLALVALPAHPPVSLAMVKDHLRLNDDDTADDVFADDPDELWRDVLRRQPGRLAWLAEAPDDLSLN